MYDATREVALLPWPTARFGSVKSSSTMVSQCLLIAVKTFRSSFELAAGEREILAGRGLPWPSRRVAPPAGSSNVHCWVAHDS